MTRDRKGWAIPSALAQCELEGFGWTWSSSGVSDCAFPISLNVFGIVAVVLDSLKPRHHGKVPYPRLGHIYMYIYVCVCMYACSHMYIYICVCVYVYMHMHICMYIYMCVCVCVCVLVQHGTSGDNWMAF